jgi:hypothetical protein
MWGSKSLDKSVRVQLSGDGRLGMARGAVDEVLTLAPWEPVLGCRARFISA